MADGQMSNEQQTEMLFMQLVMMFQGMAMQQMGKVMNPVTQKVERDLGQAKNFIDLLTMLESRTQGNLTDNEQKLLQQALFDLRMNYVDEVKKGDGEAPGEGEAEKEAEADTGGAQESPEEEAEAKDSE